MKGAMHLWNHQGLQTFNNQRCYCKIAFNHVTKFQFSLERLLCYLSFLQIWIEDKSADNNQFILEIRSMTFQFNVITRPSLTNVCMHDLCFPRKHLSKYVYLLF